MRARLLGSLIGLVLPGAATADQHLMVADNGTVACRVSERDLTRLALIGDSFASVSKVGTGQPYNDFSIQHEPVRGDLYLSVPELYAPRSLSFFATTTKGYTYKFQCTIAAVGAEQIFLTNPAISEAAASRWERQTPEQATAIRLIQAMYADQLVEGYRIRQPAGGTRRLGNLRVRVASFYEGAALQGQVIAVHNVGRAPATVAEHMFGSERAVAVAIGQPELGPGEATTVWLVERAGGGHGN